MLKEDLVKAGVDASRGSEMKVSFKGTTPLVFAFQGMMLRIDTGGLRVSDDVPAEFGIFASRPTSGTEPAPVVLTRSGLLRLD